MGDRGLEGHHEKKNNYCGTVADFFDVRFFSDCRRTSQSWLWYCLWAIIYERVDAIGSERIFEYAFKILKTNPLFLAIAQDRTKTTELS